MNNDKENMSKMELIDDAILKNIYGGGGGPVKIDIPDREICSFGCIMECEIVADISGW